MNNTELVAKFYEVVALDPTIASDIDYFRGLGLTETVISELMYMKVYCVTNEATIAAFSDRYLKSINHANVAAIDRIVSYLTDLDNIKSELITIIANIHLNCFRSEDLKNLPKLPTINSRSGAFIDLASGPDLWNYFESFQTNITYYAVDNSYFVYECLLQKSIQMGIPNFHPINVPIESLTRSDMPNDIVAIRAKNVRTYIADYLPMLAIHYSWLAIGGRLYIQEYAEKYTVQEILNVFGPIMSKLPGYKCTFIPGQPSNKFDVHTLEITKTV